MKKIVLLLIFLCTFSFSNTIGGFGDLKWGASREDVKKYLMETYDLMESSVYELDDYTQVVFKNIKFLDVEMWDVSFHFNKKNEFSSWIAESYTMKGDKTYLIDKYKKDYDLKEKEDADDKVTLSGFSKNEGILIYIFPDKVKFYISDFNYSLAD